MLNDPRDDSQSGRVRAAVKDADGFDFVFVVFDEAPQRGASQRGRSSLVSRPLLGLLFAWSSARAKCVVELKASRRLCDPALAAKWTAFFYASANGFQFRLCFRAVACRTLLGRSSLFPF